MLSRPKLHRRQTMGLQNLPTLTEAEISLAEKVKTSFKTNHVGKKTAISNSQIVKKLEKNAGIKTTDIVIRKIINHLRHSGCPICSDSTGYWWAATKNEIKECIQSLHERIDAQMATLEQLNEMYINF